LRSFQQALPEFSKRSLNVAAISVDPPEVSRDHRQKLGLTFPILADVDRAMLKRYNLLHKGGGPKGSDIALPAEMLIDSRGTIRWINFTRNATVRARPEQVLQAWDQLSSQAP
jgi:peroxiredoxin